MTRPSTTELAVLGALSIQPMSGYALRQAISETLGHFWSESFGQIYPTLAALESAGAVRRMDPGRTSGGRFEITNPGRQRLRTLLAEPYERVPPRNGLLLRLFFGHEIGDAGCRRLLTQALAEAEAAVAEYGRIRAEIEREDESGAGAETDSRYRLITLMSGVHLARAQVDWAREALLLLGREPAPGQP
jgi:DNA-binding PadR family transcriptional regulator